MDNLGLDLEEKEITQNWCYVQIEKNRYKELKSREKTIENRIRAELDYEIRLLSVLVDVKQEIIDNYESRNLFQRIFNL